MNITTTNSDPDPDPDLRLAIQPYIAPTPVPIATSSPIILDDRYHTNPADNPRKRRRSKLTVTRPPPAAAADGSNQLAKRQRGPASTKFETPKPCTECGKMFESPKALYGHMRCHPERPWRGINPPTSRLGRIRPEEADAAEALLMLANSAAPLPLPYYSSSSSAFECLSCNKVFESHQALGGHRASHKNVKGCFAMSDNVVAPALPSQPSNTNNNQHKCNRCTMIFPSGQALGGHKRRHWQDQRGLFSATVAAEEVEAINVQPLAVIRGGGGRFDLNLPPLEDTDDVKCVPNSSNSCSIDLILRLGN